MAAFFNDVRYATRGFRKDRGFTVTAVLTLALGIGAATTIFSVVNTVLLRPLDYRDPDRLVLVRERIRQISPEPLAVPAPDLLEFQREREVFEDAAAWGSGQRDLSNDAATPARVDVTRITANAFDLLGAKAAIGRTFTVEEDRRREPVAVISHSLWRTRYASDPNILGRTILLDRVRHTIAGVMPPASVFPPQGLRASTPASVFVPMAFTDAELQSFGDNFNNSVIARVRPGISPEKIDAVLAGTAARIFEKYPAISRGEFQLEVLALPLRDQIVGKVQTLMLLLTGAVLFLLLIACGNVANLMLARAAAREREFAIRAAVGAGRGALVRQWLTESLVLAAAGGTLGVFLAWFSVDALSRLSALNIPRLAGAQLDGRVLGVSVALSVLTGLLFGAAPALFAGRADLTPGLKRGGRLRSLLVAGQVALALVLLTGTGLLVRSFLHVRATDPGIRVENVLTMDVTLPGTAYRGAPDIRKFHDELDRRLRALPGVMAVGAANDLPLNGPTWQRLFSVDDESALRGSRPPAAFSVVHGDYFQALGISLRNGRLFNDADRNAAAPVLIVNESTARRLWPGTNPIGRRVKFGPSKSDAPWHTVVGVVADVKESSLERAAMLHCYVPARQVTDTYMGFLVNPNWILRSSQRPESLASAVRAAVAEVDAQMPIAHLRTMEDVLEGTLSSRRLQLYVVALFGGAALLLSALGVYGVIAYSVTQRTREIGIRMALGASAAGVVRIVIRQGLLLAGAGVAAGVALSVGLTRYIESLLYGVKAVDIPTFLAVAAALLLVGIGACLAPARRAMRVDPMAALRSE